jgi:hypothetical protein
MSQVARALDRLLQPRAWIDLFIDAEELVRYDSGVRVAMTEWVSENRSSLHSVHALVKSKIVAMGAAVANLALGGFVTIHRDRTSFERAIAAAGVGSAEVAAKR